MKLKYKERLLLQAIFGGKKVPKYIIQESYKGSKSLSEIFVNFLASEIKFAKDENKDNILTLYRSSDIIKEPKSNKNCSYKRR